MLTPQRLAAHLIDRGLISTGVVDSGLRIVSRHRNNLNFEVVAAPRSAWFAKASRAGDALDVEARFYNSVRASPRARALRRHLTSLCDYDSRRRILVLKLIPRARNLSALLSNNATARLRIASELGRAVAAVHECALEPLAVGPADRPWIFSLPLPDVDILEEISGANFDLLRIVQHSRALCACIERLSDEWRATSLIHGDLRLANCVVSMRRRRPRFPLKIADWEMSGFGEPAWDVGCVFASFLSQWIASMFVLPDSTAGSLERSAGIPLRRIRPMIGRFWASYRSSRRTAAVEWRDFLLRSVRFAAARLVQTAYESLHDESSMTGGGIVFLQVAANVAARPARALSILLGIR